MDEDEEQQRREVATRNGLGEAETPAAEETGETGPAETSIDERALQHEASTPAEGREDVAVDEREVLFLIANYLEKREESKHAAQALIADLSTSDLLGESVSWDGARKQLTYADYKRRHRDLGPDHLLHILKNALVAKPVQANANAMATMSPPKSASLLLKSRVATHRQALTPEERKSLQTEIIDKTIQLRKLQRTEALVTRIVGKFDRLVQFLEDSMIESLPADVRHALDESTTNASVNVTALAADVRAVRQLLQVRGEKAALQYINGTHGKEPSVAAASAGDQYEGLPPAYIYSRIRRLKTLNGHLQIPTYCMTYDKTGKYVITGADDRLIKVWSLRTGDLCFTLRGHVGNITDLAVNQSNTLLASSSDDKTVRVWELSTGAPVAVLLGHTSVVNSVRFHPAKNIVVTASDDGHCFCYKLPDIAKCDEVESKEQTAKRLIDQGAYLLTLRPAYSLSHSPTRPNVRSNKVLCLNFSRCGNYVVTGGQDGLGRVWDVSELCDPHGQVAATDFRVATQDVPMGASPPAASQPVVPVGDTSVIGAVPEVDAQGVGPRAGDAEATATVDPPVSNVPLLPLLLPAQPLAGIQSGTREREQRQQPRLAEVHQSRQAVVDIEQVNMITEPIAYLKGHTGPMTNILFSHQGDKIATASIKDGTTRVWQWEKKYKKITHKVLLNQEHDRERELAMLYGISSRKKTPPAVDTLVWTRNDKRLITLHSTKPDSGTGEGDWRQRMRVWDPATGHLEMTLAAVDKEKKNGHVNAVFAMDVHPTDWRIVVTAGHDGRVFLWDISEGRILKSFVVNSPEGETVALLDGSFMPTGEGFCFTDRIGRLCIFGTGSGEHLAAVPVQQYFHSDYAALVTDRHFHVIDRETQRAPSLMEPGPVGDIFLIQYPHQPPHLLASRGALTPEQYEENRRKRMQQCIESETACKVHHLPEENSQAEEDNFPLAILQPPASLESDAAGPVPQLATGAYRINGDAVLQAELLRRASWNRRRRDELQTRRRASNTSDDRDRSIMELEISSEDDHSDEDFQVPSTRRAEGGDDDDEDDDDDDDDDDEDDDLDDDDVPSDNSDAPDGDRLRRRRARQTDSRLPGNGQRLGGDDGDEEEEGVSGLRLRRRRAVARSRLIEDDEDEVEADGDDTLGRQTRSRSRSVETIDSAPEAVVVESNDGFIMGDNQLDKFDYTLTYDQMLQSRREQQSANATAADDSVLIVCSFCGIGDDQGMLRLPGNALGPHPIINGSQRLFVHDQCTIASPLCFNRGGKWYNVTKEIRRGRSLVCVQCKKRGATVGCTLERCPRSYHWKCAVACGWTMNQIQFFCPEHVSLGGQRRADGDGIDREMQDRVGLTFHREWLQLSSLVGMYTYVPQVGDYVVYFPEAQSVFLRTTAIKEPAYLRQVSRFVALKCRVVGVRYMFPPLDVYNHSEEGQKAIQCELELAILAAPSSAFARSFQQEEEKEEKEEGDGTPPDWRSLFVSDAPFFSRFIGVNEFLQPASDRECKRLTINARYFSHDTSNFVLLDHMYEAGVSGDWKVGQRVRAPYVELNQGLQTSSKMSFGTISEIKVVESVANPAVVTPWNSVFVCWDADDEDDCDVCPWELEPATAAETASKRERERGLVSNRLYKSRMLSRHQQQALADALAGIMTMDIAKDFVHPVSTEYSDYMLTVANPIDLTKIRSRVTSGYYRQLEAFIADIELLQFNCETYNVATSPIAQNVKSLASSILTTVQQLFPDFFATRANSAENVLAYPPTDFGSNQDEVPDLDDFEFEEERQIDDAMGVLDELPVVSPPSEMLVSPPRPTRSSARAVGELTNPVEPDTPILEHESPRATRRTAATATPERRVKRELAPSITSPEPPKSARKRARPSEAPRVFKCEEVLDRLTADQRRLFDERAAEDLLSLLRDFHEALMGADIYEIFASPVTDEIAPGYSDVIARPMDFGTILDSLEKYRRFSRYFEDVELVFTNAITFNTWESEIGAMVKELQDYYIKFLLDAIGATPKVKGKSRVTARQAAVQSTPPRAKTNGAPKRKRRAISDDEDEEEDSWGSNESGSGDDDDDDDDDDDEDVEELDDEDDDDDDEDSEPESDWSDEDAPRRRRLTRGGSKKPNGKKNAGKKTKKSKKATHKSKRARSSR